MDLDDTIRSTARNAGMLDLKLLPERHNHVKVLLFLDVGGSMDEHVYSCQELFSAARSEFKHPEYYYFRNFVYESVWKDNRRRIRERLPTYDLMHTYGSDHKLIFIGDASMSPYEIIHPGAASSIGTRSLAPCGWADCCTTVPMPSGSIQNRFSAENIPPRSVSRGRS